MPFPQGPSTQTPAPTPAPPPTPVPPAHAQVYQAYISCLKLYQSGVQVTQTSGMASNSLVLDVRFSPQGPVQIGAAITGLNVVPPGSAECRVNGMDIAPGNATNFNFMLLPYVVWVTPPPLPPLMMMLLLLLLLRCLWAMRAVCALPVHWWAPGG